MIVSRQCNLQTLLTYPWIEEVISSFHVLWEGGQDGEKFIQNIKYHTNNGTYGNFSKNALEGYCISMFMKDQGVVKPRNDDKKMFCIYKKMMVYLKM